MRPQVAGKTTSPPLANIAMSATGGTFQTVAICNRYNQKP